MEGGAPKGRRLDGGSGMKKSGEIVSSAPFARVPYPPLHGPLSSMGKATIRGCGFSRIVKANTGYVEKKNNDGQSLPLKGNAIKLSKILIAHVGNSVCFFHAFFLKVNNKTKKLIK